MQIPRLQSARLTLRRYNPGDFEAFAALNADEMVRRYVGGPLDRTAAMRLFERFVAGECVPGHEAWAVTFTDTGDYIGHCWVIWRDGADCPELGFLIAARQWRRGYGSEVASALVHYALIEARYPRLTATVDDDHTASIRVLERASMKREREERDERGVYFIYSTSPNQGAAANRRPAGQLGGSGSLPAIVAAHRAFPAAVAELGR
ncbi:MAG TPA: GNAT family N-acetyltransferase [Pirellulaceae bacterium]|nr:GNAT family N-acetyltransferase [Pirellulaceae bacterium]